MPHRLFQALLAVVPLSVRPALPGVPSLAAQVGHAPEKSPYRDIRHGSYILGIGGRFEGSGGVVGVAPHAGNSLALRWAILANKPLQLSFSFAYGDLERLLQDPTEPPETRTSGPVSQRVIWTDVGLQLNLTGSKSWRGIAPFVGAAIGLAFTESVPEDMTGFRMGTKFYLAPMTGTRIFLGQRLHVLLEARALFWSVKYPGSFRVPPDSDPDLPPVVTTGGSEWVASPWLQVGLGWAFSLPF